MIVCPECGNENFAGADECAECLNPLTDIGLPEARSGMQKRLMEDPVKFLLLRKPVCTPPDATVRQVLHTMNEKKIGCILVEKDGKILGIFTERDALMKIAGKVSDLDHTPISAVMTPEPEVLQTHHSMASALNKMSVGGYRHLPLVDENQGNKLLGIVSARDLLRHFWGERAKGS